MFSLSKKVLILSMIIFAGFFAACLYDYLFALFTVGISRDVMQTLWTAYSAKPFRFSDIAILFFLLWLVGIVILIWHQWTQGQKNNKQEGGYSREELTRAIQMQYQKRFWVSFALYSSLIVFTIVMYFVLKEMVIWYERDPWYSLLSVCKDLFPYAIITLWLGGLVVLLFNQWRRSASDVVGLVDSIEQMQEGSLGDRIRVPKNLAKLEPVLQDMFDSSCKDRAAAAESEKRKRDLILYLAHDLKTPLTSVIGYLSLLNEHEGLAKEQRKEYLKIAQEKALRLESLTNQFFEISRFNLHEVKLELKVFNLKFLLLQLCDEFFPLLEKQDKEIEIKAQDNMEVCGDADKLARVFDNILRNAIAYSFSKSTIEVQASLVHKAAIVSIKNRGATIPKEQLNSIFEKFFRLDEARASSTGGAGLGLAIAREIISKHKGSIGASSKEGVTVFTVTLPQTNKG